MALTKVTYKDGSTVITAQNLNDIQDEIINQASTKAPVASPNFTGTPKAPTATAGTSNTQIASTAFVQAAISSKKNTQTAVADPSASGTSATFIASISQNAQGVITPTKKTVRTMSAATASVAGATGLVPAPAAGENGSFLRGDATWQQINYVNRNLLDNWYFVGGGSQLGDGVFPINQRGQTSYPSGNGIDRWQDVFSTHAIVTIPTAGEFITVANNSANYRTILRQTLSINAGCISGKTVTASILLENNAFYSGSNVVPEIPSGTTRNYNTLIGMPENSGLRIATFHNGNIELQVVNGQNVTLNIKAIKLELGDTQTLAHQENGAWVLNELPNFAEELAKCQRYLCPVLVGVVRSKPTQVTSLVIDFVFTLPAHLASNTPAITGTVPTVYINGQQQTGFEFSVPVLPAGSTIPAAVIRATKSNHGGTFDTLMLGAVSGTTFISAE